MPKPLSTMSRTDALRRWPRLCAHVICESLGYASPDLAASIVLAAAERKPHYCEWIMSCYRDDPIPAVCNAIQRRKYHTGYMAHYPQAITLVRAALGGAEGPLLASWF